MDRFLLDSYYKKESLPLVVAPHKRITLLKSSTPAKGSEAEWPHLSSVSSLEATDTASSDAQRFIFCNFTLF